MNMKEIHNINLLLLKEIERICSKYNIKYRLEAGTLLGAVRHKGFIPWDDDCDVVFLRKEYDKFVKILESEKLSKDIVFVKARDRKDFFHDFTDRLFYTGKVYRKGKDFKEKFGGLFQYLWVDFFIIDNVPKEKFNFTILKQKLIYALAIGHRDGASFKKGKNPFVNIGISIIKTFGKNIPLDKIYDIQDNLSRKYNNIKNISLGYFSNYPPVWLGYKSDLKNEKNIIYTKFENTKLPIIKDYDKLLKYYYGDYMKLPEKEKRIAEHKDNIW